MLRRQTLLMAHDQSSILSESAIYLRNCGYDVIEADSEKTCIQLIAQQGPPLVLCNLRSQTQNGCRCLEQFKASKANGRPFVVGFSNSQASTGATAGSTIVNEVLPHPSHPSDLLPWIKMFFRSKEKEYFYQSIVENISDLVFLTDDQGRITYVHPNINPIFGFSDMEIYQLGNAKYFMANGLFSRDVLDAQGQIQNIETTISCKDGTRRTVRVNVVKVDMPEGAHLYIFKDISQRAKSEARFRALFENAPLGILLHGPDGQLSDANPAVCEMIGLSRQQLMEENPETFLNKEALGRNEATRDDFLAGKVNRLSFQSDHKRLTDGAYRETEVHCAAYDVQGEAHFLALVDDITERKQIQEQLQQSHKMEAIGTLAGGIAHEFNNLLSIILGNSELASDEITSTHLAQGFLNEIQTACQRAKDVVRKILSFARKTAHDPKAVHVGALAEEAVRFLRSTIPTTIKIHTNIKCRQETILADATEINQVMMNLFTNAAHAMPDEKGAIAVDLEPVELNAVEAAEYKDLKPGAYVRLSVSDTGIGVPAENLGRIFDPYFTTKDVDQGTGMGLAIVYGIVKKHGGDIVVHSQVGEGTDMKVLLPLMAEFVVNLQYEKAILPTGIESILVVDDEPSIVKILGKILTRLGYDVVSTNSSAKALAMVKETPDRFDLVISDMAMPEMAGDELARKVKQICQKMPIILCTGHSERIDEVSAKAMGISAFALKPIEKETLAQMVRQVLDQGSS